MGKMILNYFILKNYNRFSVTAALDNNVSNYSNVVHSITQHFQSIQTFLQCSLRGDPSAKKSHLISWKNTCKPQRFTAKLHGTSEAESLFHRIHVHGLRSLQQRKFIQQKYAAVSEPDLLSAGRGTCPLTGDFAAKWHRRINGYDSGPSEPSDSSPNGITILWLWPAPCLIYNLICLPKFTPELNSVKTPSLKKKIKSGRRPGREFSEPTVSLLFKAFILLITVLLFIGCITPTLLYLADS
ncbi:hypothetical protein M5K25_010518 [Dendrobium thyrsiflorum]|uniref:Uncharacterized protein n=1 Tax=Dendrobium thyrsiflorum TaxID=117978 RepID=A0ABD0V0K9_DENTH